ncbi:MAG: enoyl-CoA hydratase/isomerase family protein [Chloroflexi bacterium]|nr:enoyl-CoA hydratase/isomerase family protein [Chloroflexota bacterium]MDA1227663.1 enoyl-CoA hydratase/isomerase family protein [Chloroflexota bacterium]
MVGSDMTHPTVLYSKKGNVAHVVLNRPRVINAYNMQMRDELYESLAAAKDDTDVRALVLSGSGERGFCAGADLTEFGTAPSLAIARQVRWERDIWGLFLSIRKPMIAALHGFVIGSGVEMACLCDVRIASENAVFSMPEVALGMVPAAGGTQTLPRVVGAGTALELILTNRSVAASEAKELGLVHQIVANGDLMMTAISLAEKLASRDPAALSAAKSALVDGLDMHLDDGLRLEKRLAMKAKSSE